VLVERCFLPQENKGYPTGTIVNLFNKTPARGYTSRTAFEDISERLRPFSGTFTFGDDERPSEISSRA